MAKHYGVTRPREKASAAASLCAELQRSDKAPRPWRGRNDRGARGAAEDLPQKCLMYETDARHDRLAAGLAACRKIQ